MFFFVFKGVNSTRYTCVYVCLVKPSILKKVCKIDIGINK